MKRIYLIIVILAIVLIIGGGYFYQQSSPYKKGTQECHKENGYCIYNNIPIGMKYSEPSFFGEDVQQFKGNLSEYLIRNDDPKRLAEVFNGDWSSYKCKSTEKTPAIIEYFYDLCEGSNGQSGCWYERRAVVCEDIYFVQDFTSTFGPRLYGPFKTS